MIKGIIVVKFVKSLLLHHYSDYFDWTGKTFRHTNGEFVESSHYSIKNADITHGFKVKRALGTQIHKEKSLKSIIWHNTKRAGFTKSSDFGLRSNPCNNIFDNSF